MPRNFHILFDYDGVLVKQRDFAGDVSLRYGLNEKKLRSFFERNLISCLEGKQDIVDLLSSEVNKIGWKWDANSLFKAIYFENEIYNNELIEHIKTELLTQHFCYIATNQDHRRYEWIRNNGLINGLFKEIYSSSALGTSKPKVSYFKKIHTLLSKSNPGLKKEEIIFIDDSIENLKSAEIFGLNIHHYQNFESFRLSINEWLSGRIFPSMKVGDLELVEMKLSHSRGYSEILSEPNKHQFLTESGPISENRCCLKIMRNKILYSSKESIYWSILGGDQVFIGFIGVHKYNTPKVYISYGIHPAFRRKGLASKVLRRILNWKHLDGKTKIMATHKENSASYAMLNKMNLSYKGIQKTNQGERHIFEG